MAERVYVPGSLRQPGRVRRARTTDVAAIQDVERAAGELFRGIGMADVAAHDPPSAAELEAYLADGRAWVSVGPGDTPVGYALVDLLTRYVHLEQLSVRPDYGRQGRGRELFEVVVGYARAVGRDRVTLSTFAEVPWNAPLYARWGFRLLRPQLTEPELAAFVEAERSIGLDVDARVLMAFDV
jgi:GNAT superfamily N-acetyltransferase